jgi:hypothetical protein
MSAASLSTAPSLNTLPERAFTLYCDGLRSPAIAQHLGVPERTVRSWIAKIRDDLAAADTAHLREEFVRAVEHLHHISAAAWQAFEREQNQAPQPSSARKDPAAAPDAANASNAPDAPPTAPNNANPRHGPRYLRLALDAQRQISHLLNLNDFPRVQASNPNSDPTPAHILAPLSNSLHESAIPAKTAMDVTDIPAESAIPAKTATLIPSSFSVPLRELRVLRSKIRIPAKTATPTHRRDRPARRHRRG